VVAAVVSRVVGGAAGGGESGAAGGGESGGLEDGEAAAEEVVVGGAGVVGGTGEVGGTLSRTIGGAAAATTAGIVVVGAAVCGAPEHADAPFSSAIDIKMIRRLCPRCGFMRPSRRR